MTSGVAAFSGQTILTGANAGGTSPIAVVIISLNSDPQTVSALQSILAQDVAAEIVVVNTGRGSLRELLAGHLDRITLVESGERRFVGAARNLGIRHSSAPVVAFLASDCIAAPLWLRRRLEAHDRGHAMVASALAPAPGREDRVTAVAWASAAFTHTGRFPQTPPEAAARYGLSYRRSLFDSYGLFDESLRVGEDSDFNARCAAEGEPAWDERILTLHVYPDTLAAALGDQFSRARRIAAYEHRIRSRSPVLQLARAAYRGWVIGRRLRRGDGPPEARQLVARMIMPLLFAARCAGILSLPFSRRRELAVSPPQRVQFPADEPGLGMIAAQQPKAHQAASGT